MYLPYINLIPYILFILSTFNNSSSSEIVLSVLHTSLDEPRFIFLYCIVYSYRNISCVAIYTTKNRTTVVVELSARPRMKLEKVVHMWFEFIG